MENDFQEAIKANFRRRLAIATAASLITRAIGNFTPEGLEVAITDGWSLIDSLRSLPPATLQKEIFSIPGMDLIMMGLAKDPISGRFYAEELTRDFPLDDIIARVSQTLPQHAQILAGHREWLEAEKTKFLALLG